MKKVASAALLVLALALVAAPFTAEAKKKKASAESAAAAAEKAQADSFCSTMCEGKKGPALAICKESCELSQRSNLVLYGRIQCKGKCTEQKGITAPAMKVCEEQCDKDYVGKAAEVTAACNAVCIKEKNPLAIGNCKKSCTPPPS